MNITDDISEIDDFDCPLVRTPTKYNWWEIKKLIL